MYKYIGTCVYIYIYTRMITWWDFEAWGFRVWIEIWACIVWVCWGFRVGG